MSAAADFLAAIAAEPDDDTPRLVFADYLEENGDPDRAALIRVQCELAGLPSWDRRAKELRHRQRVLLARHGRRWLAELPAIDGVTWGGFERGFVTEVTVPNPDLFAEHAAAIRAATPVDSVRFHAWSGRGGRRMKPAPWLRRIGFHGRYDLDLADLDRLLDSPLAEHLRVLDLGGLGVENAGAERVARAAHLGALEEIDFSNCFVGVAGVAALAEARHLAGLRALRFGSYGSGYVEDPFVTAEGVRVIARAGQFAKLRVLDLGGNQLTDAAVRELLTAKTLANLEEVNLAGAELTFAAFEVPPGPARWRDLNLTHCYGFGDAGAAALSRCGQLAGLARLRLRGCEVGDAAAAALAASPLAGSLRELYLADNDVAADGAYHLAAADWPHLHTLDLRGNGVGAEGAKHLAESAGLTALAELDLEGNAIGNAGAAAVAAAGWAGSLRRLSLRSNDLAASAARAVAASPPLRGLTDLDLSANPLGPDGAAAVAAADWPALTDLNLAATKAGDAGAAAVAGLLGRLVTLDLGGCGIGPAGAAALAAATAPDLGELNLEQNDGLTDAGAAGLAAADWPALRSLNLANCKLGPAGVRVLVQSRLYGRLRRLRSYGNNLSSAAGRELMRLEHGDLGPDWVSEDVPDPSERW